MGNRAQEINLRLYERAWFPSRRDWLTALRWRFHYNTRAHFLMFRKTLRPLQLQHEGNRIFDIGFGSGHLLFSFAPSNMIYGVDLSPQSVERATAKARARGYRDFHFAVARSDDTLPFADSSMDLVIASHIIEHLEDDEAMLREIRRVLTPNGWAVIIVPIDIFHDRVLPREALLHEGYLAGTDTHVRRYNGASFGLMLQEAGLQVTNTIYWDAYHDLLSWIDRKIRVGLRRRAPLLDRALSALLNISLCALPESVLDVGDRFLVRHGLRHRQASFTCQVRGQS